MEMKTFVVVCSYFLCVLGSSCPPGFFHHEESCYVLLNVTCTWAEAMQLCETFGSGLAMLETQREDLYIKGMLRKLIASIPTREVWLGGTDMLNESEWLWAKTFQKITYTRWAPNEPNNGGMNQHCLGMEKDQDFQWDDFFCQKLAAPLCERSIELTWGTDLIVG